MMIALLGKRSLRAVWSLGEVRTEQGSRELCSEPKAPILARVLTKTSHCEQVREDTDSVDM